MLLTWGVSLKNPHLQEEIHLQNHSRYNGAWHRASHWLYPTCLRGMARCWKFLDGSSMPWTLREIVCSWILIIIADFLWSLFYFGTSFCVQKESESHDVFLLGTKIPEIAVEYWISRKICKISFPNEKFIDWLKTLEAHVLDCFLVKTFKIHIRPSSVAPLLAGGLPFDWHDRDWQHLHFSPWSLWQRRDGQVSFQRTSIGVNHQLQDMSKHSTGQKVVCMVVWTVSPFVWRF